MTTAPELAAAAPPTHSGMAHLRCHICYPVFELGVTKAVCGHVFGRDALAPPDKERCVVCVEMDAPHFVHHWANGEIPEGA